MHSLSLAQNILQAALIEAEKHQAKHIKSISMKLDRDFSETDSLEFCLQLLSKGTIAEGATIGIELAEAADQEAENCTDCADCCHEHAADHCHEDIADHIDTHLGDEDHHHDGELLSVVMEID